METNSSSKTRDPVPTPHAPVCDDESKSNLPIGVNYRLTMAGLPKTSDPRAKSDGVISYTNGITRSNSTGWQKADKESRESGSWGSCLPLVSFYYLLSPPSPLPPHVIRAIPSMGGRMEVQGQGIDPPCGGLTTLPTALLKSRFFTLWFSALSLTLKIGRRGQRSFDSFLRIVI